MGGMIRFFVEGGIWMIPIGIVSMIVLAVAMERIYILAFVLQTDTNKFLSKIRQHFLANQMPQVIQTCDATPRAAVARVVKAGIMQADQGIEQMKNAMDEATLDVMPQIEQRASTLSALSSMATLLGLLGTVMGLIEAFMVVADAPADQKSILLSKAIAVAMNTTAFGLIVAIPAMAIQLYLSGLMKKLMDDLQTASIKLENWVSLRK